jgi:hypothetical protein
MARASSWAQKKNINIQGDNIVFIVRDPYGILAATVGLLFVLALALGIASALTLLTT